MTRTVDPGVDPNNGLIYMRARWYDPGTGQFLSVDPLESQTQQAYAYADDNPVNETDPTGEKSPDLNAAQLAQYEAAVASVVGVPPVDSKVNRRKANATDFIADVNYGYFYRVFNDYDLVVAGDTDDPSFSYDQSQLQKWTSVKYDGVFNKYAHLIGDLDTFDFGYEVANALEEAGIAARVLAAS
jgi:RHS repeat-associated protein